MILDVFPENIAKSIAEGQILQVVVFSILFAVGLALVEEPKRKPMVTFADSLSEAMFKFTNLVMHLAPVGVFGAIACTTGQMGLGAMVPLLKLLVTLYVSVIVFVVGVLLPIIWMSRIPLGTFLRAVAEPTAIAFATSASQAALPSAMERMEGMGVPRPIVAFVLPTGYSFNMCGGCLYLSLGLVFIAQAAGIRLSYGEQFVMLLMLMLSSKGIAGVPRGSLVILLGAAINFHLPIQPFYLLVGIDALMDMGRTALNVFGNCLATVVVAQWEDALPVPKG
jgi:proton glutamate symport protein